MNNNYKLSYILLDDLLPILEEFTDFKGKLEIIPNNPNPTGHGDCCTCSDCGYFHDECVCYHNDIVRKLIEIVRSDENLIFCLKCNSNNLRKAEIESELWEGSNISILICDNCGIYYDPFKKNWYLLDNIVGSIIEEY